MSSRVKRAKRRAGKGSIVLIAGLLFASAGIRVGVGAGQAFATENTLLKDPPREHVGQVSAKPGILPEDVSPMIVAFQDREARIAEKERQIEVRLKALKVADEQIERRLVVLQEAEESLRATIALADAAAEDDLTRLTSVYENMKPKDAAALFEEMEPTFAAGFLGRMRPDAAAGVMAGLSPKAAYSISVILAGRNASVPKT